MPTALTLNAFGLDHLRLEEHALPALGPTEVHVRFHAAALNFRDLMIALGRYNPKMQLPRILGSDASGEVLAVGPAVTQFKPGDRVCSLFFQNWLAGEIQPLTGKSALGGVIDGVFATERILPETGLIHIPAYLTFEEAATLPCAALTAWNALVEQGHLRAGQTVLIQGTGGVSLFALQIAKMHGATVLLTSSSDEKLERARRLGADHIINYKSTPDWDKAAKDLTSNLGVDHVIEVGGQGTISKSLSVVRPAGHVHVIGVLSGTGPDAGPGVREASGIDVRSILTKSVHLHGIYVGSRAMFHRMNAAVAANRLHPVIDRVFPLANFRAAFEHMHNGSHLGKIVLSLD
ncbi:MAG TPA: NAD(P)-dependent alcohol dehydrogenase [Acidobacteriaceae bacterium]|jgi:NADPH:quinone reductase-like Zn-dependent oxidoreductase|nr:NAD(P)-dependent alcohol dehydrogenase [Acidobacteriaceae bacterium]